jgi:hypothetical protein
VGGPMVFDVSDQLSRSRAKGLVTPDFDQEGAVQAAGQVLATAPGAAPLLAGVCGLRACIDGCGDRRADPLLEAEKSAPNARPADRRCRATRRDGLVARLDAAVPRRDRRRGRGRLAVAADLGAHLIHGPSRSRRATQHLTRFRRDRCHGRFAPVVRNLALQGARHGGEACDPPAGPLLRRRHRDRGDAPLQAPSAQSHRICPHARRCRAARTRGVAAVDRRFAWSKTGSWIRRPRSHFERR